VPFYLIIRIDPGNLVFYYLVNDIMPNKQRYGLIVFSLLILAIIQNCTKEYSREGLNNTTPPIVDTTPSQQTPPDTTSITSFCVACAGMDKFEENRWSFKAGNSFQCGPMDTALMAPERNAFTFFGPSSCSSDTSMVITVYIDNYVLNKDLQNIVIPKVDFRFTKLGAPKYLLISQPGTPFNLTIESYDHQTKMTTGTFSGYAYKGDGTIQKVDSGKFKVKLH
jgi:hypothetical protein